MIGAARFGRVTAALLTLLILTVAASPEFAAAADADELIRHGVDLRRSGDDLGALQLFQQAFQVDHTARAMAQMGLAEQALGRWAMAYEHLNRALEATTDPWIRKNRAAMSQSVVHVSEHVGQVEILGGSDGVEVRINGASRGKLPLAHPVAVSTGMVTIDLLAPGFVSVQRTTVVRARETVRESFDAMVPVPARVRTPAPGPGPAPVAIRDGRPEVGERRASPLRGKLKWVAWGLGAGALGVGIFGWARQVQAGRSFTGGCDFDPDQNVVALPASNKTVGDCRDLRNQVDANFRIELGGLVGAGVLAATGVMLWLAEPAPLEGDRTALSCSPGMTAGHGPWWGCKLTF